MQLLLIFMEKLNVVLCRSILALALASGGALNLQQPANAAAFDFSALSLSSIAARRAIVSGSTKRTSG